jgi:hypothetical protein
MKRYINSNFVMILFLSFLTSKLNSQKKIIKKKKNIHIS